MIKPTTVIYISQFAAYNRQQYTQENDEEQIINGNREIRHI